MTFDQAKFTYLREADSGTKILLPVAGRVAVIAWGWLDDLSGVCPLTLTVIAQNEILRRLTGGEYLTIEHPNGDQERI